MSDSHRDDGRPPMLDPGAPGQRRLAEFKNGKRKFPYDRTIAGRVVYNRKIHLFTGKDVWRIYRKWIMEPVEEPPIEKFFRWIDWLQRLWTHAKETVIRRIPIRGVRQIVGWLSDAIDWISHWITDTLWETSRQVQGKFLSELFKERIRRRYESELEGTGEQTGRERDSDVRAAAIGLQTVLLNNYLLIKEATGYGSPREVELSTESSD